METKRAKTWMGMAVALAAMAVGSAAWGETEIVGNVEWTYWADSGEATVESANPAKGALTVPSSLGGLTVTGIAGWSFGYCETLTSVAIPNSVTSVGESVFEGCGRLQVLEVPASWQGTDMLAYAGVPDGCEVEYRRGDVLAVETAALPGATEGKPYEAALTASGGTPPYTWSCPPGSYSEKAEMGSFEETGDKQGWADDDACWELALPFAFPFFGREYGTCYVSDNGTIAFDGRFSQYSYNEDKFLSHPMLAAMWADLGGEKMDIAVESRADAVTVRWTSSYYWNGGAANFSATLRADGGIELKYGDGNDRGGTIGISAGDGMTSVMASKSQSEGMGNADDIVFVPLGVPAGMELTEGGVLRGTPDDAGSYEIGVSVTSAGGGRATAALVLDVAGNPAMRPIVTGTTPPAGYVNVGTATGARFEVAATRQGVSSLTYAWTVDGQAVAGSGSRFDYKRTDDAMHLVECTVGAADLPKTATVAWRTGILAVAGPEDVTVSLGATVLLRADVASSLPAEVTWLDGDGAVAGEGETLVLRDVRSSATYRAVATSAFGTVTGRTAAVTVTTKPSVGRIFRLTGAPFAGNRLVLRAKAYGDLSGATWSWKRDGAEVGTSERLDIASLGKKDFGTYTLTVKTAKGTATSEAYVLEEAPSGVPVGWGASGSGRTQAPEGESGFVQVASGMNFNLGLKTNGTVVAWGYNGHGGCDVPAGLAGVSSVAAGGYESKGAGFAVKTDGKVVAWGTPHESEGYWETYWVDDYDENGDWIGSHEESRWYAYTNGWDTVSTMPEGLSDVVQMAVGGEFAIALRADGSVVTWGRESGYWDSVWDEELGDWTEKWVEERPYAVPEGVEDAVAVAAGGRFAVVLLSDGTAFPFGPDFGGADEKPGWTFPDSIGIGANSDWWTGAAWAVHPDGTITGAANNGSSYQLDAVPRSDAGFESVDGGEYCGMALDRAGQVFVWGGTWYGQDEIPPVVQGNAFAVAAGGYHCTALLRDRDGDSIPDAEEPLYGRDPSVWEDWRRTSLSGTVAVDGGELPPEGIVVSVFDAEGNCLGRAEVDGETGRYEVPGLLPGKYFVFAAGDNVADDWAAGITPPLSDGAELPPDSPWTAGTQPVAVGSSAPECHFALAPGQARAWCRVEPRKQEDGGFSAVPLPSGATVYLDLWPVAMDADSLFDLGEIAASHAVSAGGMARLPHIVSYKDPANPAARPAMDNHVRGRDGYVATAHPGVPDPVGAVRIATDPQGVEVWIDRADESLGTTPLTVGGMAAGSHVLLLKKKGHLRPRPIEFAVEAAATTEIELELHTEGGAVTPMSVEIDADLPEMPIFLDYLPTGLTTPARVGGMDPTEASGWNWRSVSHSILLRRDGMRPYAVRAVPDGEGDQSGTIVSPNQYGDDDGDGMRNDHEVFAGRDPFDAGNGGFGAVVAVTNAAGGSPAFVPVSWVANRTSFHARFAGLDSDESRIGMARDILGERAANGRTVLDCYVMGVDPDDADAALRLFYAMTNGVPRFSWNPDYSDNPYAPRRYTVQSSGRLLEAAPGDGSWTGVELNPDRSPKGTWPADGAQFYRVEVSLPDGMGAP